MRVHAVRVLTKAAVIRSHRRFDVSDVPGFRSQHAQIGGRVHSAGADDLVVGLPDQAALGSPEGLQLKDDVLKGKHGFIESAYCTYSRHLAYRVAHKAKVHHGMISTAVVT